MSVADVVTQINRYFASCIFIFGCVGNILNILVLSQRTLRSNSCASLFLGSSIAGLCSLIAGLTPRMLSGIAVDLSETNQILCKFRGFTLFTSRAIAFWLIMLATIDRWLLSCPDVHRRHLSTIKNSNRSTAVVVFLSIILHSECFYCYNSNLVNTPGKCFSNGIVCRLINDMLFAACTILIPLCVMTTFGFLTLGNIRRARNQIHSGQISVASQNKGTAAIRSKRSKKTDHRLLIMLLVQVVLLAMLTIPSSIEKFYSTLTADVVKSTSRAATENLIYNSALLLTYLANGIPFYVYTLSGGSVFRKAFFDLIRTITRKVIGR
ncbi:unnamed protein product [Adineta ricciae]|uniref:G-protein coupled receptors family 1 profile domain-containing protein n=1 Tax=Adineta ricciae TaxID=249248 RepID=A0A814NAC5_ADIRI|nr:unnamed protein product [Adineta ricciae]CAF1258525.1 unnamed protein product [Adineta ricciae]